MDETGGARAVKILDGAAEAVDYVCSQKLLPGEWEEFHRAVQFMHEALRRADLPEVDRVQRDMLDRFKRTRQRSRYTEELPTRIPSPEPTRSASDNLTEELGLVRQRYPRDEDGKT
ncbi:hypothetical protein ACIBO1_09505 [Micromonospora sp. NPDC049903]|uniref:hypothetical protein n=1 Tax=Micromonospora sp. NPDC049903 TaxID=3364276 RepID=UPI003795C615